MVIMSDRGIFKVQYILDDKIIFNNYYMAIPRVGELVRLDTSNQCYVVKTVVHCLDESKIIGGKLIHRVNIAIEKE